MQDSKKVIEGLKKAAEELARYAPMKVNGRCQMYFDGAIHLLKEQEPKSAIIEGSDVAHVGRCPSCHVILTPFRANYCYCCGKRVKWDG